jgi:FtsZ-interacting cell division protein ZipA
MLCIKHKSKKNGKYKYKVTKEKTKYLLVAVQTYSQDGFKDKVSFYLGSKNTALLVVIIVFGVIIGIILLIVGIIYLLRIIERCERRKSFKRERKRLQQEDKQRSTQNEQVTDQQQMDNQNQVEQKNNQNKTDNQQQQNNENQEINPPQGQTEELHLAENIQDNNQIPPTNSL